MLYNILLISSVYGFATSVTYHCSDINRFFRLLETYLSHSYPSHLVVFVFPQHSIPQDFWYTKLPFLCSLLLIYIYLSIFGVGRWNIEVIWRSVPKRVRSCPTNCCIAARVASHALRGRISFENLPKSRRGSRNIPYNLKERRRVKLGTAYYPQDELE